MSLSRPRFRPPVLALLAATALFSLLPVGRLAVEWARYTRDLGLPLATTPPRGFDGVRWEGDRAPVAAYVFPNSPADRAGVAAGDTLRLIDFLPAGSAAAAALRIERATGTVLTYEVQRGALTVQADVAVGRYPTFLYPLTTPLWAGAAWGFSLAAFLHLLALLTVLPLWRRSARARSSAALVAAALLWVGGTLVRMAWLSAFGVPAGGAALAMDAVTLVSLLGWTAFPALLLRHHLLASSLHPASRTLAFALLFAPPALLAGGVSAALLRGHVGPLPADAFVAPILFYVCTYLAVCSVLALRRRAADEAGPAPVRWQQVGNAAILALALAGAVFAFRLRPAARIEADVLAGWFVTALQLFSLLPVALVSLATLRVGGFDLVLARGLRYVVLLGGVFASVAGGAALLDATLPRGASPLALGALLAVLVVLAERAVPVLWPWLQQRFETDHRRALRRLDRFGEQIRFLVSADALAEESAAAIGSALQPRSALVLLRVRAPAGADDPGAWAHAGFPPTLSATVLADASALLPEFIAQGRVWGRNDELCEAVLPPAQDDALRAMGAALAVPILSGAGAPLGLLLLGRRARRLAVYSTEDVERLAAMAGQLALAVERLGLIEREKALVRQTAEAELAALRAQINPHFLFNALNTVASLIAERPDEAESTVESLAGLFRDVLSASGRPFVPLRDELRLVRRYLDVEQARFGDALRVRVDAPPEALDREVPAFAVQTLVENAVKHGVERKRGGGAVHVEATPADAGLTIRVADTGVGIAALYAPQAGAPPPGCFYGVGLRNVSDRLAHLYGDNASLAFESAPSGTTVTLHLPGPPPGD